ncbi:MAG: sugar ABC transporter substrate-binding protein [Herpetosiphon sp.]
MDDQHHQSRRTFLRRSAGLVGTGLMAGSLGNVLAACGAPSAGTSASTPIATTNSSVIAATTATTKTASVASSGAADLVYMTWSVEQKEVIDRQLAQFKQSQPNLNATLNVLSYNDYWSKLPVSIAGGTGPDLFVMTRPQFEVYSKANQAADISADVANSAALKGNLAAMSPTFVNSYKWQGQTRGIPFGVDSTAIVFNKTLFEKEGMPLPTEVEKSWTWDELRSMALKLTKRSGDEITQYGFLVGTGGHVGWWELLWSNGGEIFNEAGDKCLIANQAGTEAIQFLADLMLKDKVSPTPSFTATQNANDLFVSGKIAIMHAGNWSLPLYEKIKDFEWDAAELPHAPKTKKRATSSNVLGYIVNPNTKHRAETIRLIEQLTSIDSQKIYADTGVYIPTYKEAAVPYFAASRAPKNRQAFQRALDYSRPMVFSQWVSYPEIIRVTNDAMEQILKGSAPVEKAWKEAEDAINATIKKNQAKG